ncbi:Na+/H+ antiporter [Hymenobacter sp. GOD-10R]|uniref:Na+/H+ antiporter n=1 Tax=Hymenobacter sp. GOD-10R TaxID=3093922 RepID=UPI002D782C40|nr:Na+/H+ antiporter [Hymenobacter sp. GOD-10R]WRQ29952.1 Na+/H+ antiporter [Hymenobacter sp. GOD-10R]
MRNLEIVVMLMAVLAGLSAVAQRFKLPYPVLLVFAGLLIGITPTLPNISLNPDIVFFVFLPPLLYEASFNMSWHDFKAYRQEISMLAIGLVFFTTMAVACLAHYFIPGFSWPLAFVLGAIVSPPDAVAATSVTRGLNLPTKITSILEGESLVNDASALIAYRYAVAAVVSGTFSMWDAGWHFLLVAGGGIGVGLLLGYAVSRLQERISDPTISTTITLLVPFVSYSVAEHVETSGVLAVVFTGLVVSWRSYEIYDTNTRVQKNSFWDVLSFLLNGFVFILIGLQLPFIIKGFNELTLPVVIGYGLLISFVAIVIRIVWVFPTSYLLLLFNKLLGRKKKKATLDLKSLFITSWAGMRGVVSLATALALPFSLRNGHPFPHRNEILMITFIVILITLVLQSLTLPWLIRRLDVQEPEEKAVTEEQKVRLQMAESSLGFLEEELARGENEGALEELKARFQRQVNRLNGVLASDNEEEDDTSDQALFQQFLHKRIEVVEHQRALLVQLHKEGKYNETTIRKMEAELDALDISLQAQLNTT